MEFSRLKARFKQPRFWFIFLAAALLCSLVVNVASVIGIRQLIEPPAEGQFHKVLQAEPLKEPTNVTGTLLEHTVDELSGGVVPILLFPNSTDFCGDPEGFELRIAACVDRFDATYIAFSEELAVNFVRAYDSAMEADKPDEAERINQWERHLAAHEFAHILQYNYRTITLPFQEKFENGFLKRPHEDMAECYAQWRYPLTEEPAKKEGESVTLYFHNFPASETFALCTEEQMQVIEEWLDAIPYPHTNRWESD